MDIVTQKKRMLVFEAMRWVGYTEQGGDNKGQIVEMFQKAVDGKAQGEPWCLAMIMHHVQTVDRQYSFIYQIVEAPSRLVPTEHCLTLWNKTPIRQRRANPEPGCIVLWQYGLSTKGHAGIITEILADGKFKTIEGNTGAAKGTEIVREGDGIYEKVRDRVGSPTMKVLGFLSPW